MTYVTKQILWAIRLKVLNEDSDLVENKPKMELFRQLDDRQTSKWMA